MGIRIGIKPADAVQVDDGDGPDVRSFLDRIHIGIRIEAEAVGIGFVGLDVVVPETGISPVHRGHHDHLLVREIRLQVGHCDIDTILGNLDFFLHDLLKCNYAKLFCLGHMELYKNTYENNRIFMRPIGERYLYKESFSSSRTTVFDECGSGAENINDFFKYYNKPVYEKDYSMNCSIVPTRLVKVTYLAENASFYTEKPKVALYVVDRGNLFRLYKDTKNNKIVREDFLYIHLQLRKMKFDSDILSKECFKILENQFAQINNSSILNKTVDNLSIREFNMVKRHALSLRFFKLLVKWKINKLKRVVRKING